MDLSLPPELEHFRNEVREFFATDYPADLIAKVREGILLNRDDHVRNQQALASRGWLATNWPRDHGGPGWDAARRYVFEEEADRAGIPTIMPMAIIYVAPVIYTFGTDAQKRRWLPDILASRTLWAQGYSEPESGSDLASLSMSAVRDGDDYVLNGSKIWTSYAQWADWIFCLVRTSREKAKQAGISFLCAEMNSPGITIHPIISIDGVHHLNRIDFENVRVPVDQRIGEEGKGWHYATFLLQGERLSYAHVARKREAMKLLHRMARDTPADGWGTLADDPNFAARMAHCDITIDLLDIAVMRALTAGQDVPAAEVSSLKIVATEAAQQIDELFVDLAGTAGLPFPDRTTPGWTATMPLTPRFGPVSMASYLFQRAETIFGGATEVQKNIVWRSLGG
ncbi:acyl-CoA dehydrogenase family protein [Novosphingobium cyanobacteriorum]|uniref:Acyl-CoA dehydrogenase family protein n=1 Tax=Novosphingobium cyanobacteriorum TaxID=3024215 RepID=A0ABT6CE36_9SPHN|nr:acyl-CoA dehydrogenase family protein [Novosphingobium cyanobacteriorum]MDF8332186.1 acyl-CoA dehydrogenase family protein [Novosphingobium cyanobacteriorum]